MDFQNSLLNMPLLVGVLFIIVGFIMYKFPPKKINMLYGYRTKASMESREKWDFAQIYSSKLMMYCGFGLVLSSLFGLLYKISVGKGVFISTLFIIISVILLIYKTEKAIKAQFKNE